MCAYVFEVPGWIWAPRYTPVLCFSKSFSIGWLFSSSSFCVSCSLLRRIFDLSSLMMHEGQPSLVLGLGLMRQGSL
jgi:hypothetical protein